MSMTVVAIVNAMQLQGANVNALESPDIEPFGKIEYYRTRPKKPRKAKLNELPGPPGLPGLPGQPGWITVL